MTEFLSEVRADWAASSVWATLLFILSTADIASGIIAAFLGYRVESKKARKGVAFKLLMVLSVIVAAMFDGVFPSFSLFGFNFTLASGTCLWWITCEGLSLLEKWGMMGLPLPPKLKAGLRRVQDHINSLIPGGDDADAAPEVHGRD